MGRTSKCDGDGATPKKRRSGKSNWAKFNEQRKKNELRKKGVIPTHRLYGKQAPKPLETVPRRRLIQKAVRVESESETEDANGEGHEGSFDDSADESFSDDHHHRDGLDDGHGGGLDGSLDGVAAAGCYAASIAGFDGGLLSGCVSPEEFTN